MEEIFRVKNVKCGGCAAAIEMGLKTLPGVHSVQVVIESGEVTVQGDDLHRPTLAVKLGELGYPEA